MSSEHTWTLEVQRLASIIPEVIWDALFESWNTPVDNFEVVWMIHTSVTLHMQTAKGPTFFRQGRIKDDAISYKTCNIRAYPEIGTNAVKYRLQNQPDLNHWATVIERWQRVGSLYISVVFLQAKDADMILSWWLRTVHQLHNKVRTLICC